MVAAGWHNMLDVRSMHGRSQTHDVYEASYKKPNHHFGRIPIVIHLGDFLQLSPTANIGLIEDVNALNEDGSHKYEEPPSVEVQHAIKVFKSIPHVFELRGTSGLRKGIHSSTSLRICVQDDAFHSRSEDYSSAGLRAMATAS